MSDLISDIYKFHDKFKLIPEHKTCLEDPVARFRYLFMVEELGEWRDGHFLNDLESCLDGMIDLVYVGLGTLVMHGFTEAEVKEAWRRVHEANMKKVRASEENPSVRNSMYDVVKPKGWVSPSLEDLCR